MCDTVGEGGDCYECYELKCKDVDTKILSYVYVDTYLVWKTFLFTDYDE